MHQPIAVAGRKFERVKEFKYFGTFVTEDNDIAVELKRRINVENACYYLVGKLLSSRLLSKRATMRIYKGIILPVVLYGCETWPLTQERKNWFRVFENKILRRIFGPIRDEETGEWRKLHNMETQFVWFARYRKID